RGLDRLTPKSTPTKVMCEDDLFDERQICPSGVLLPLGDDVIEIFKRLYNSADFPTQLFCSTQPTMSKHHHVAAFSRGMFADEEWCVLSPRTNCLHELRILLVVICHPVRDERNINDCRINLDDRLTIC